MIGALPSPGPFGATVVAGQIDGSLHGAAILKAVYDLIADGSAPRRAVLRDDPAACKIATGDKGTEIVVGTNVVGFELEEEADIALAKARCDLVVKGYLTFGAGGAVFVNAVRRSVRAAISPVTGDMNDNLFGWHGRDERFRAWDNDSNGNPVRIGTDAQINNFHRRSFGFTQPSPLSALPPAAVVTVHKTEAEDGDSYSFRLPADRFTARLRFASGHCPDKPGRWAIHGPLPMVADTMIADPDHDRLTLLWRVSWPWTAVRPDQLRRVDILREEP